ncbi:S-adenosylmethionine:tRNA ribosyltransferase-isomerase [Paenibacillus flagellatus]|uniref:S-adenosylmethionine:tRNA ribosyltransferase-isomerase n=1 Tax=Paenibacillus flagellatus TaxID=2211139 RepID=A0A2V5KVZ0_9BACL|nr:S-adenosylmethionine:tRNA ribosyltransferase-isomerase [Paenibacillus flagellatus]PYI53776.1 S-adenosylmethionine:tRNA ribosyltransferase-isomerase [Paenibacillus flagellatus]
METKSLAFELPEERNAGAPPERRGLRRDRVRLMVQSRADGTVRHTSFHKLADELRPGDCLVLNESRTIPASLRAVRFVGAIPVDEVEVRLARRTGEAEWEALLLHAGGFSGAIADGGTVSSAEGGFGTATALPSPAEPIAGGTETLRFSPALYAEAERRAGSPFVALRFNRGGRELFADIYALGEPVRYEYTERPWDLDYYQTVYGTVPGSIEMPSAGRAFTWEMLFALRRKGVAIAYVQLHTGLSYLYGSRLDPADNAESYAVSAAAAETVNRAKRDGGRIIAVGTTVVRCLESAADANGSLRPGSGRTSLYVDEAYPLRIADGLMSGLHEPEASHLHMLSAFVGGKALRHAYEEAIRERYLWHEFGDIHLMV